MTSKKKPKCKNKEASKENKSSETEFRLQATTFFLTYKGSSDSGQKITKQQLANYLLNQNPNDRMLKPIKHLVCEQTYEDGTPHFHAVLVYQKRKQVLDPTFYDYKTIHPNIQTMRNMKAALQYVYKEDKEPLTNMDIVQQKRVARAKDTSSLYELLQQQMLKDPLHFDVDGYCATHGIFKQIYKANYAKAINLIRRAQPAYARKALKQNKNGIKLITPTLIEQKFTNAEIQQYFSHECYQKIVSHINQIYKYPNKNQTTQAPLKTRHLLIVGGPDIGKTSLIYHRANSVDSHPGLAHYYPVYYLSVGQKYFPPYRSYDYSLVNWQQFTIVSDMFPKSGYARLLNYLDGSVSALPQKGRPPAQRQDNPKHILTSNRTLTQHINKTFKSPQALTLAHANLPARIDCVVVPEGRSLHFLRKLFVSADQSNTNCEAKSNESIF